MQDEFNISRRKTLAALGTIGVASAGAGLGTSAYFSDQETFENNSLVAGELDLLVDWEEHYSDWSADEVAAGDGEIDWTMSQPESPGDYYGFPVCADEKSVWVNRSDTIGPNGESSQDLFMNNTSVDAFPDADNDGVQDMFAESEACSVLADVGNDDDGLDPSGARTDGPDTRLENGDPAPLINLGDVKPGDFGEVTFSFHLCDNPGYVWLNGQNVSAAENGQTEPEADDPDEEGPADEVATGRDEIATAEVELLDEVQTCFWYDEDCDNLLDGGEAEGAAPCVQIVLDASGSMDNTDDDSTTRNEEAISGAQTLAKEIIDAGGRVGVTFFSASGYSNGASLEQSVDDAAATDVTATQNAIAQLPDDGSATAIGEGILTADDNLSNCSNEEEAVQIVVTDGSNNAGTNPSTAANDVTGGDADDHTDEIFAVGTGGASESQLLSFARPMNDDHTFLTDSGETLDDLLSQLGETVLSGEKVFFEGSLRDALLAITDGNGVALSPPNSDFAEGTDPDGAESRECFAGLSTNCVGFSWWLPVNHANEIQGDSTSFDIGFYTEQCRHNDGSGMNNEAVDNPDEVDA